jgi:hypothetical protein
MSASLPRGALMAFPNQPLLYALALAAAGVLLTGSGFGFVTRTDEGSLMCVPDVVEDLEAFDAAASRDPSRQALVRYLSRRFQIASASTEQVVGTAWRAAQEVGLDPYLVLAVIAVESRFNPVAESGMGARGLMQIIPKYHQEKLVSRGGEVALLDPESNIEVGTQILKEYVHRTGTLEAGLQFYNGALKDSSAQRVMAERARLIFVAGSAGT